MNQLTSLIEAAAVSLEYVDALDTERWRAQVELIIAATGLPEDADVAVSRNIHATIKAWQYSTERSDGVDKLVALIDNPL